MSLCLVGFSSIFSLAHLIIFLLLLLVRCLFCLSECRLFVLLSAQVFVFESMLC